MAYDAVGVVFIFGEEFFGAGEGYLIDILIDVVGIHANAMVGDGESAGLFINGDAHLKVVAQGAFEVAESG